MAFSYRERKKRRQRIAFIILTVFLSLGLLGTSIGWFFNFHAANAPSGVQQPSLEKIIADLESQAKANPEDADIAARLARAYLDAGKMDQALKTYDKAVQLRPENSDFRIELALVQFLLGHYDEAVANFKEEIKRHPDNARAHYYYGQVLALGKGDYESGIRELEKFIQLAGQGDDVAQARKMIEEWKAQLKK
ncbi:tetratricopeptide repeat protein [Desulfofundulus thermosubterraneus]|uniref:Tetratricopeptide repeat-containing protein n=1 Tax=Desulfofundulus thermosubterraneus DSM 16057 TaxID=1121432 RepID=A0A1M6D950_9FIRM|nr:tetratricopeptide repeat protein [Desulfofundulus thermosubterraneus]SHI69689.1 Tetratricopeptide repeat-containing protein [Desulfofundulus thermosubterraneus DSM 16057]